MARRFTDDPHPLVRYGKKRGWNYEKTAAHFGVTASKSTFRVLVNGFSGVSWERARRWSELADGEFSATEVMMWHERNRRAVGAA